MTDRITFGGFNARPGVEPAESNAVSQSRSTRLSISSKIPAGTVVWPNVVLADLALAKIPTVASTAVIANAEPRKKHWAVYNLLLGRKCHPSAKPRPSGTSMPPLATASAPAECSSVL